MRIVHHVVIDFSFQSGKTVDEINIYNNKVRRDHQQLMLIWSGLSTTRRGGKPKAGALLTQQFACMYCRMHYLNHVNGCGCIQCKTLCENDVQSNRDDRPYFDKSFQCSCPVCKCPYSVRYYRLSLKTSYLSTER